MKITKTIQTILLVITCILFLWGSGTAIKEGKVRTHNGEKIKIELTKATPFSGEDNYGRSVYRINMNFKITNTTKTKVDAIDVTTIVKDKSGKVITRFTSTFGSYSSGLQLEKGESITIETYLEEKNLTNNAAFTAFYESNFSNLEIINEVTSARFDDGYKYEKPSN